MFGTTRSFEQVLVAVMNVFDAVVASVDLGPTDAHDKDICCLLLGLEIFVDRSCCGCGLEL